MDSGLFTANNVWMMLATALVFFMHTGFAFLEIGLTRSKNTINILFKNIFIITVGLLLYYAWGFNMMYPGFEEGSAGIFQFSMDSFGISAPENGMTPEYADGGYTWWTDFLFQGMFAATAATIVSGAVAERMKIGAFMIFTVLYVGLVYPIVGAWKWGGGFLDSWGFYDFAGSTLVHSVGGWAALAGIILLGPRNGKYTSKGIRPIQGHSMPLAAIGVFLLFFGWFGFNGGSVLSADPALTSLVFTTTAMAAAAGAIGSFFTSYFMFKSYDLSMVLNGILGGLVGITAGADIMSVTDSIIIGLIAGIIIPISVTMFDKLKLDDPVGATSVHLVCGIWGTLAVAIFGDCEECGTFGAQITGIISIGVFTFIFAFILFFILKAVLGIRVNDEEQEIGLDIGEHEMPAYA